METTHDDRSIETFELCIAISKCSSRLTFVLLSASAFWQVYAVCKRIYAAWIAYLNVIATCIQRQSNKHIKLEVDMSLSRQLRDNCEDGLFIPSYGVACVRKNSNSGCYEILMIKKRHTYSFLEFVRGFYDPHKDRDLEYLFDTMTITEKSTVQSRNFHTIWNYCNGEPTRSSDRMVFNRALRKYNLLKDRGILLELLSKTQNATLLWEIPKGRSNRKETSIVSATREFEEETGLTKDLYRILFDEGTIEYSFVDCNVRYKYIYYIAIINKNVVPRYDYGNEHMLRELSEVSFMTSTAIHELNNQRLAKTAKLIIKKAKRYLV